MSACTITDRKIQKERKSMKKKIPILFLTATMCFALMLTTVFTYESYAGTGTAVLTRDGADDMYFDTASAALTKARDVGGTVKLLTDTEEDLIIPTNIVERPEGGQMEVEVPHVTLDLNGKTVTGNLQVYVASTYFTLTDTSSAKGGALTSGVTYDFGDVCYILADDIAFADSTGTLKNDYSYTDYIKLVSHDVHTQDLNPGRDMFCLYCGKALAAELDGGYYLSFEKALENANKKSDEAVINILSPKPLIGNVTGSNITVNLNGKGSVSDADSLVIKNNACLTVSDISEDSEDKSECATSFKIENGGTLKMNNIKCTILGGMGNISFTGDGTGATLTLKNCVGYAQIEIPIKTTLTPLTDGKANIRWAQNDTRTLQDMVADGYGMYNDYENKWVDHSLTACDNYTVKQAPLKSMSEIQINGTASKESDGTYSAIYGRELSFSVSVETLEGTAESYNAVSYKWYDGDDMIANATASSYVPTDKLSIGEHNLKCIAEYNGFALTKKLKLTVTKKPITNEDISITVEDAVFAPGTEGTGTEVGPTVTVEDGDIELTKGTDYKLEGTSSAVNTGSYTIKIVGMGNYSGELTKAWNINPLTIKAESGDTLRKEYDGNADVSESAASKAVLKPPIRMQIR